MKAFDKFCGVLKMIASAITIAFVAFLTVLITVNVIARYILNSPITWQYEITLVCLAWVVFIGMSITFSQDEHMRLTFVCNALPKKVQPYYLAVLDTLVLIFVVYSGYISISVVQNAMQTLYQTIPVSRGFFYMPYPIGCFMSACHIVNVNYKRITAAKEAVDAG